MDVREIAHFDELSERHGADWRRLAAASEAATPFQSWEWICAWRQHYGHRQRLLGLAFIDGAEVVGLAALTLAPGVLRTLRFLGTGGTDYLDLLAAPGSEAAVAQAFGQWLEQNRRRWDWVDLQQVRPGAVVEKLVEQQARTERWEGETCPYLALPESWEAFRQGLSKKLRQNIGYYERALRKQYVLEMRLATRTTLESDLDAFFELHQRRWNLRWMPGAFASRRARAFHQEVARALLEAGMLRLHMLHLDGQPQAALYCFQKGTRCHYYLGGFEPTLARWSLGTVLTARAIQEAIARDGASEFDFLRGDEGYKYRWGARDRRNGRLSVTQGRARSYLLSGLGRTALQAEQALKSWMHRRHGGAGA